MSTDSNPLKPATPGNVVRRWLQGIGRARANDDARRLGRLAIDALPDEWTALEAGKLYAIYTPPRTPGTDALIWESAREARVRDVTVVLARARVVVAQRLRELGFSDNAPASGWPRNLSVLAMAAVDGAGGGGSDRGESDGRGALGGAAGMVGAAKALKGERAAAATDMAGLAAAGDVARAAGAGGASGTSGAFDASGMSGTSSTFGKSSASSASRSPDTPATSSTVASTSIASASPAFAKAFGGLRALKRFGFRPRSLYFIEGAERWFNWDDADALAREGRMLADWCEARNITLVLLLGAPSGANELDDAGWLTPSTSTDNTATQLGRNEFHAACAGVARMERTHGELLWHVDFWRAQRTLVTGEVASLRFTESGRLTAALDLPGGASAHGDGLLARDEQRVVVTRGVVSGHEAWLPPQWEVVDDQAAVLAACADAQAATVVLDYVGGAQLDALCASVHALRRHAGRALKIVVVERGEVLRHQYELLVLSLGANLVLGRDLPFSRMQSLLRSLQGQLHTRPVAADYRAALSAALSDDVLGYLPPAAFCERVRSVVERSAMLQLPHVLVKLTLRPQCAHVDALKHCVPRRAGDVFTADAAHLYVFLFACRLADSDAALARIFDVPVEPLVDELVHLAEEQIGAELDALAAANRRERIADYSDLFVQPARGGDAERAEAAARQLKSVEEALARARVELEDGQVSGEAGRGRNAESAAGNQGGQSTPGTRTGASEPATVEAMTDNDTHQRTPRSAPQPQPASPRATAVRRRAEPYPMPIRNEENE